MKILTFRVYAINEDTNKWEDKGRLSVTLYTHCFADRLGHVSSCVIPNNIEQITKYKRLKLHRT